jgi:hypothetical protein
MSNLQSKRTILQEPTAMIDSKPSKKLSDFIPHEVHNNEIAENGTVASS